MFSLLTIASELQPHVRARVLQKRNERDREVRVPKVNLVPMSTRGTRGVDKNASFGQHLINSRLRSNKVRFNEEEIVQATERGGMEMTWTPSSTSAAMDDMDDSSSKKRGSNLKRRKGTESFGAGMERGGMDEVEIKETEKKGRTQRRKGIRSGSRNVFRNLGS